MNHKWLDKRKARVTRVYYREPQHDKETPSEYYIYKSELLNTVFSLKDSELILEIMEGAPASWNTILTMQLYLDTTEFQDAIRFHEDNLMRMPSDIILKRERCEQDFRCQSKESYTPRVYLIGSFKGLEPPNFPEDNSNVS